MLLKQSPSFPWKDLFSAFQGPFCSNSSGNNNGLSFIGRMRLEVRVLRLEEIHPSITDAKLRHVLFMLCKQWQQLLYKVKRPHNNREKSQQSDHLLQVLGDNLPFYRMKPLAQFIFILCRSGQTKTHCRRDPVFNNVYKVNWNQKFNTEKNRDTIKSTRKRFQHATNLLFLWKRNGLFGKFVKMYQITSTFMLR